MLYCQKYHNLDDIDEEFIPSLERLLSGNYPSLLFLKREEKNLPSEIYLTYYLLFSDRGNSPVGFIRIEHIKVEKSKKSFHFLFLKSEVVENKKLSWKLSSKDYPGMMIDPLYLKEGKELAQNILHEYFKRDNIIEQELFLPHNFNLDLNLKKEEEEEIKLGALKKLSSSYKNYLSSLKSELCEFVMNLWKAANKEYTLGEYHTFKEIFEYRENGRELYDDLKKDSLLKDFTKEKTTYYTIEQNKKILGFIYFLKGVNHQYFYGVHKLEKIKDESLYHQLAILNFFEREEGTYLHFLNKGDHDLLFAFGFEELKIKRIKILKN